VQIGWHSDLIEYGSVVDVWFDFNMNVAEKVSMSEKKLYTVNYWLKNTLGDVVDTSEGGQPMMFLEDSEKVIPGIRKAVMGRQVGDRIEVTIPPALAYGAHLPELIADMPISAFDGMDDIRPGMKFQTNTGGQAKVVKVIDVKHGQATVDANHPLAGLTLIFELDILDVRTAEDSDLDVY
jgi:FKBP-type peptidyl-prolyl cis-trans isomerase SlyD